MNFLVVTNEEGHEIAINLRHVVTIEPLTVDELTQHMQCLKLSTKLVMVPTKGHKFGRNILVRESLRDISKLLAEKATK